MHCRTWHQKSESHFKACITLRDGPVLIPGRNSGHLITDPNHAGWSMQLLVSCVFCLAVWFPSGRTKQWGQSGPQGGWRAPGQRAWIETTSSLQIPQMPFHCASLFSSIYPCVRAFFNVMMSFYVHNRQLLVYLFCIASPAEVFDSCSLLHWHRVIQLGGDNRSQTWGQEFFIWRQCGGQNT